MTLVVDKHLLFLALKIFWLWWLPSWTLLHRSFKVVVRQEKSRWMRSAIVNLALPPRWSTSFCFSTFPHNNSPLFQIEAPGSRFLFLLPVHKKTGPIPKNTHSWYTFLWIVIVVNRKETWNDPLEVAGLDYSYSTIPQFQLHVGSSNSTE